MRLPNLLATKNGRLTAFFLLYLTEGIPLGFAATAVATQLRRLDVGPAEIGAFVGSFYLPWAFKWVFGPLIDVFASERWGRRRGWILFTQVMMALTLLSTVTLQLPQQLGLFTAILLIHNTFGAMQDVAIDALACNTLHQDERGLANGMMFGGAYLGQAIGGAGVLFLIPYTGLPATFVLVSAVIVSVTMFIVLPMQEPKFARRAHRPGHPLAAAGHEIVTFGKDAYRAFVGSRAAWVGVIFGLLPCGAYGLNLALQSTLAVELGMNDNQIAQLALASTVLTAFCCVGGGWLSDRFGRRRMLGLYIFGTLLPGLALAWFMAQHGWNVPVNASMPGHPATSPALVTAFWTACLAFAVFHGFMYGTRTALFMDITTPAVAATQFTAYMAMFNLVISYSASWQGLAIERWGFPKTLVLDSAFGLLCLAFLPLLTPRKADPPVQPE